MDVVEDNAPFCLLSVDIAVSCFLQGLSPRKHSFRADNPGILLWTDWNLDEARDGWNATPTHSALTTTKL